jgi:predicted phosphoribosyltransferase
MRIEFVDRNQAGQALAHRMPAYVGDPRVIVLGLARGGVPVAAEVARFLAAPLDAFIVRKLGVPGHAELAMGAVASGGATVLVDEVIQQYAIPHEALNAALERERAEIVRREQAYRGGKPYPDLAHRIVILVDDGVATGASMQAAIKAVRTMHAFSIVAAAPVMSREGLALLHQTADECKVVATPSPFYGVGFHYRDFNQTTDAEVRRLLDEAGERRRTATSLQFGST